MSAVEEESLSLGELMRLAREAKELRDKAAENLRLADESFNALKLQILQTMRTQEQDSTSVKGVARARVSTKVVPNVTDWDQFYEYIMENNLPELLQKRILLSGYQELRNSGEVIPGVEDFEKEDVTFTIINE